jgi:hypothetical protein
MEAWNLEYALYSERHESPLNTHLYIRFTLHSEPEQAVNGLYLG